MVPFFILPLMETLFQNGKQPSLHLFTMPPMTDLTQTPDY